MCGGAQSHFYVGKMICQRRNLLIKVIQLIYVVGMVNELKAISLSEFVMKQLCFSFVTSIPM